MFSVMSYYNTLSMWCQAVVANYLQWELPAPQIRVESSMKYTPILSALLVFSATLGASAAPKHPAHKKHMAKPMPIAVVRPEPATQGTPGGFRDVPPDHWAAKAVETLRQQGIVKGYPDSGK